MRPIRIRLPSVAALVIIALAACNGAAVPSATLSSTGSPSVAPVGASRAPSAAPSVAASVAPAVSGQIVFEDAGRDFLYSQVWIENADGSNVRKLVSDAFTDAAVSLSPEGKMAAFYRFNVDPKVAGSILVVNVDGSGLHELDTGSVATGCDAGPEGDSWSPDGRRIVYARYCFDKAGAFVESGLWTINIDGTDARRVTKATIASHTEDHRAGWSPDGKQLVFERIDTSATPERAAIFTVEVDGKNLRQVTPWKLNANDPDWSPDGTLIAFNSSAEPSPTQNIWTIRPDGTGAAQLTTYNEAGQATFHPSWSPDGTRILYSHNPSTDGWGDFFTRNRDGSDQHVIAQTPLHENHGHWGASPAP
jgi:Tol biopolymer transport system component